VTHSYEETRRPSPAVTGAMIGGAVALLAVLLWKFRGKPASKSKGKRAADEESPILIKGGSLSVALHDNAALSVNPVTDNAYGITGDVLKKPRWDVAVAKLEAGFPVTKADFPNVTKLTLKLVNDDNGDLLDIITVTHTPTPGVLTFTAENDDHFGRHVSNHSVSNSPKHKNRAFHKKVNNKEDFEIAEITLVSNGTPIFLQDGPEYTLAFEFL
jgi:hypothetical protein